MNTEKAFDCDDDWNSDATSLTSDCSDYDSLEMAAQSEKHICEETDVAATSPMPEDPLIVIGMDLSPLRPRTQFYVSATGVFAFTFISGALSSILSNFDHTQAELQ